MTSLVTYAVEGPVASVTMDDGKANALSPVMLGELHAALDRAAGDGAVLLVQGRPGVFSGGFDLQVLMAGGQPAVDMLLSGFELAARLLSFPRPVVMACTGHAVAMGAFVLLSGDYRVGPSGPFRFVANEVALGMTMPHTAVEILRQRLAPAAFNRALVLADVFSDQAAVDAGFLDLLVSPAEVRDVAREAAERFSGLHMGAHEATKLRGRASTLSALRQAIEQDAADLAAAADER